MIVSRVILCDIHECNLIVCRSSWMGRESFQTIPMMCCHDFHTSRESTHDDCSGMVSCLPHLIVGNENTLGISLVVSSSWLAR